jgi:NRAMP (natural resistance-associated macrophage protein)-like metal ion transporter
MSVIRNRLHRATLLQRLGPGVITGAADDDPSGIATYSQAGAAFGFQLLWTMVLTFPLMAAVQGVCARIGRVTGQGLAANLKEAFPGPWAALIVALLFIANTINIGADLAAMGEAAQLVVGWGGAWHAVAFGAVSLLLQVFVPYHRYVRVLKWLTLVLFAYVGVVLVVKVDWPQAMKHMVWPQFAHTREAITLIVAVFGTTISPYLFFWQSSQEVEEIRGHPDKKPLILQPGEAAEELGRIRLDTYVGMAFSNIIALAIMVSTAVTLHAHGVTNIQTAAEAARALEPIAGPLAFALFALGIIGTGLLAVPVLAGSAAYAMAEAQGWRFGLELKPAQAAGFYTVIAAAVVIGTVLDFSPIDPIKALFWAAVINGVIAAPIMAVMMLVASSKRQMGQFTASRNQKVLGWLATLVMATAAIAMIVYSL